MNFESTYFVPAHTKPRLSKLATSKHVGFEDRKAADAVAEEHRNKLAELQEVFYASQSKALLIVLQGMDTAGKDGTIRHIFSGINPQGCDVSSFKVPTPLEARHDFLWRCQAQVPPRGMIGIFNRSHYEDVLAPRVHGVIDDKMVKQRLDDINRWEETLTNENVVILKFFLHISRDEQTERLQSRIDTPSKRWKLSPADFEERQYWPQYQDAYEKIFEKTSHKHAPWFVIPADHKWYRDVAISAILVQTMTKLKLKYPAPSFDPKGLDLKRQKASKVAGEAKARAGAK